MRLLFLLISLMKRLIITILGTLFITWNSYALDGRVQEVYSWFLWNIQQNYTSEEQKIILNKVNSIAQDYIYSDDSKISSSYMDDLLKLSNESLYDIWLREELSQTSQKSLELTTRLALENELEVVTPSSPISRLISNGTRDFIATNSEREFIQDWGIYRLDYSQYFVIESSNTSAFSSKQWIMIQEWWQNRFIEEYSFKRKIPYSELITSFAWFFTPNHKVVSRSWNFYAYNFTNFRFFEDDYGVYQTQIVNSWFSEDTTFIYRDEDWKYSFITDYSDHGIIPKESIFWVPDKHVFLDSLRDDSKYPSLNIGGSLENIENIVWIITAWKNQEQKIEAIYAWVLDNIEYTRNVDLNNEQIFSWIEAFRNSDGVCTWYTKLMLYMLWFAWIHDAEVIRWHVIDAADFPDIGHAWIRIGNKYYDPTFDDPVWITQTKQSDEYKYFWLPRDIFYANRFEYEDLPEEFESASESQINQYIYSYLTDLLPKYSNQIDTYKVFKPILFREQYNISFNTIITPSLLSQKVWSYTVDDNSFRFSENNEEKRISHIRYYVLNNSNTENILEVLNYNVDDLYLFNWQNDSWDREWRLAYEIEVR